MTNSSFVEFRPRFAETDLMGVVHHATYALYFEMGRVEWMRRRGITYRDWADRGLFLPVVDLKTRFLRPAKFDELLTLKTTLKDRRAVSMLFEYELFREKELLTEGSVKLASIDANGVLQRMPSDFLELLARNDGEFLNSSGQTE